MKKIFLLSLVLLSSSAFSQLIEVDTDSLSCHIIKNPIGSKHSIVLSHDDHELGYHRTIYSRTIGAEINEVKSYIKLLNEVKVRYCIEVVDKIKELALTSGGKIILNRDLSYNEIRWLMIN